MKRQNTPFGLWYIISFLSGMLCLTSLYWLIQEDTQLWATILGVFTVTFAIVWGFSAILHYLISKDK